MEKELFMIPRSTNFPSFLAKPPIRQEQTSRLQLGRDLERRLHAVEGLWQTHVNYSVMGYKIDDNLAPSATRQTG